MQPLEPFPVVIRAATSADAAALTSFGARAFRDTFGPDNTPENMEAYVSAAFTVSGQQATLDDPAGLVLVAQADEEIAGYAQLRSGPAPLAVTGPRPIEIQRFYVAATLHGRGVAQELMHEALRAAASRGAGTVWLGVWERNARAIGFYRKLGFETVGSHRFLLGTDAQTDLLMTRGLADGPRRHSAEAVIERAWPRSSLG